MTTQQTATLIPPSGFLSGELVAPAGTRIPFNQAAAPLGWTIDNNTAYADAYATVRPSAAGGSGGSSGWSTWNASTQTSSNINLTTLHLPIHTHTVTDPGHTHVSSSGNNFMQYNGTGPYSGDASGSAVYTDSGVTTTNSATTGITVGTAGAGLPFNLTFPSQNIKYTDFIIGVRS